MNERITKIVIDTLGKEGVVNSRVYGHWLLSDEQIEKFAELIVRECADVAADQSAIKPEFRIRKHFGVEE